MKTVVQGFDNSRFKMINRQCFDKTEIPKKQKKFGKTVHEEVNLIIDRLAFSL